MGIYRFRLSDILPNALFNKLKNTITITKTKNPNNIKEKKHNSSSSQPKHPSKITIQPQLSEQRKSYHFTKDDPNSPMKKRISDKKIPIDSPRKSSFRRRSIKLNRMKPVQTSSSDNDSMISEYGSSSRDLNSYTFHDIIQNDNVIELENNIDTNLPPITTKKNYQLDPPSKVQITSAELSERKENGSVSTKNPVRRFSGNSSSTGVKLRTISPRIGYLRIQGGRKSMSGSRVVVKTSKDPERDFKDSMMVMIAENNIRTSKDLEDLLVWYLTLNNDEYHDIIVDVFKQIWLNNIVRVQVTK